MTTVADAWDSAASYEAYVGRWSRRVAPRFAGWAGIRSGSSSLDVGCGTGALSMALASLGCRVTGIDLSKEYVANAASIVPSGTFRVANAMELPFPDATFDAAVSGLVLNFIPSPSRAIEEMRRVVRPGGVVAAYVWDYAGRMELMRHFWDAAVALDPAARDLDEGLRFPMCKPAPLERLWTGAGLRAVASVPMDEPTTFADFEDYWRPFLGGQGPAPSYCMSLPLAQREALRARLKSSLPRNEDGKIALVARAWAVRGLS